MPGFDAINPPGQPVPNFQQAGAFQQTLNPVPPSAPAEGPPTTPQELEQRKSGWQDFITKLQSDPAMRQAAFMTAAQLLRGPDMGESAAGSIGRALQMGTLAHGFVKGNETRQALEQARLEEQKKLNASNIEQNAAQTGGLLQQQEFARQTQPLDVENAQLTNQQNRFTVSNQGKSFDSKMATEAADRAYKQKHGEYFSARGQAASTNAAPKTAAGVQLLREKVEMLKTVHPMGADEHPLDYEGRINQLALTDTPKGNPNAVRVQALQKYLDTHDDPKAESYKAAQKELAAIGMGGDTGGTPAPAPAPSGGGGYPPAAFDRANEIAKGAGKPTFVGPDGKTYKVK